MEKKTKGFQSFLNKYGADTTSNFQLLHWGKQLRIPNFQVLMKDQIKNTNIKLPVNIIVNNNTNNQSGSHWSAFHMNKKGEKYWFDSYASPALREIVEKFKSPILGNDTKYQEFDTSYCGQMCLYFLDQIQDTDFLSFLFKLNKFND